MGGQQKDFISDIVFFQHQDGMPLKVRRHFLQCSGGVAPRATRATYRGNPTEAAASTEAGMSRADAAAVKCADTATTGAATSHEAGAALGAAGRAAAQP
jgi:hypothetical protein